MCNILVIAVAVIMKLFCGSTFTTLSYLSGGHGHGGGVEGDHVVELQLPVLDVLEHVPQDLVAAEAGGQVVLRHEDVRDQLLAEQVLALQSTTFITAVNIILWLKFHEVSLTVPTFISTTLSQNSPIHEEISKIYTALSK